jgi:hypothetical protein
VEPEILYTHGCDTGCAYAVAEAIDEAEAILKEIQSLPELKINTPVNKVILENIDSLLKLEGSQKGTLNLVLSQVKLKVTSSKTTFYDANILSDTVFVIT